MPSVKGGGRIVDPTAVSLNRTYTTAANDAGKAMYNYSNTLI